MNIAILTNFNEFNPGYSLTGIVVDQAEMLARYGHKVFIFVNEQFNDKFNEDIGLSLLLMKYSDKIVLIPKTVFMHLKDYNSKLDLSEEHKAGAEKQAFLIKSFIEDNNVKAVLTHDFIFTGWNLPYAVAIKEAQKQMKRSQVRWLHWVHSIPSSTKDWWFLDSYPGHNYIVFPTRSEVNRVAESFNTKQHKVLLIPHIKDIRTWYNFSEETKRIIDAYPNLMNASVVQVYPCSSDRLHAKQLHLLIRMFGYMKEANSKVFLLAANQWATGKQRKEDLNKYIELAGHCGLNYGDDFAFTSEYYENDSRPYEIGISKRILRELQLLSSLFIFPTMEESFGLVAPEAAFSGAMMVINKSLPLLTEVVGLNAAQYDFGSFCTTPVRLEDEDYLKAITYSILGRMNISETVMTKIYCRIRYNMDNIYHQYYLPYILH